MISDMKLLYHIPQAGQTHFYGIRILRDAVFFILITSYSIFWTRMNADLHGLKQFFVSFADLMSLTSETTVWVTMKDMKNMKKINELDGYPSRPSVTSW